MEEIHVESEQPSPQNRKDEEFKFRRMFTQLKAHFFNNKQPFQIKIKLFELVALHLDFIVSIFILPNVAPDYEEVMWSRIRIPFYVIFLTGIILMSSFRFSWRVKQKLEILILSVVAWFIVYYRQTEIEYHNNVRFVYQFSFFFILFVILTCQCVLIFMIDREIIKLKIERKKSSLEKYKKREYSRIYEDYLCTKINNMPIIYDNTSNINSLDIYPHSYESNITEKTMSGFKTIITKAMVHNEDSEMASLNKPNTCINEAITNNLTEARNTSNILSHTGAIPKNKNFNVKDISKQNPKQIPQNKDISKQKVYAERKEYEKITEDQKLNSYFKHFENVENPKKCIFSSNRTPRKILFKESDSNKSSIMDNFRKDSIRFDHRIQKSAKSKKQNNYNSHLFRAFSEPSLISQIGLSHTIKYWTNYSLSQRSYSQNSLSTPVNRPLNPQTLRLLITPLRSFNPPYYKPLNSPVNIPLRQLVHRPLSPKFHSNSPLNSPVHSPLNSPVHSHFSSPVNITLGSPVRSPFSSSVHRHLISPVHTRLSWPVNIPDNSPIHRTPSSSVHIPLNLPVYSPGSSPIHNSLSSLVHISPRSPVHIPHSLPVNSPRTSPVHRTHGSPVFRTSGSPVLITSGSPVHRTSGSPVHRTSGSPVHRTSGSPVHRTSGSPVHRTSGSPIHRSLISPVHTPLNSSVNPLSSPVHRNPHSPVYRSNS